MFKSRFLRSVGLVLAVSAYLIDTSYLLAQERLWGKGNAGNFQVKPFPIAEPFRNTSWSDAYEKEFQERVDWIIRQTARAKGYGGTFFENEKRAYGWAMLSVLGGYEKEGIAFLESEDADADRWHRGTEGIDFYPSFTLKHQVRKYFYFGPWLTPAYKDRMFRGAKQFTEIDPLGRPHPAYKNATGWGPDAKNSWVDVRETDNLKLMRETSIYLFAEETGNTEVRDLYRQRLQDQIVAMYWVGMGEWDSENYMGHTVAPLVNLYDFARDSNVKLLAKAALDRAALNLATKYWRGGYNGPSRRDYGHPYPFGGSAAMIGWLWFGGSPQSPLEFESDEAEFITSGYRPPAAIVEFARRNFSLPATILSVKPDGSPWRNLDQQAPRFFETQYYSEQFQFGTLRQGTEAPDINGFKILVKHPSRGADTIMAAPCNEPLLIASPRYTEKVLAPNSAVGQYGNLAIYLTQESDHPYRLLIPKDAQVEQRSGITFVTCSQVTLALWPLQCSPFNEDSEATAKIQKETKPDGKTVDVWPGSRILTAHRTGKGFYGFAIELSEGPRSAFIEKATKIQLTQDELSVRGAVNFTGTTGKRMRLQWGNVAHAIHLWMDGQERTWDQLPDLACYHSLENEWIEQGWKSDGVLNVKAGGHEFRCEVTRDGKVTFSDR
jgi:hypothetical protein